eukprot:scaffold50793_cov22-Tisochrysis_lutea.AAC.1
MMCRVSNAYLTRARHSQTKASRQQDKAFHCRASSSLRTHVCKAQVRMESTFWANDATRGMYFLYKDIKVAFGNWRQSAIRSETKENDAWMEYDPQSTYRRRE